MPIHWKNKIRHFRNLITIFLILQWKQLMDGWGQYFPLIWPRIVLEPFIPSLVCNLDNEAVIYYGYLPEAENINVKTCQLMDYTFDGN